MRPIAAGDLDLDRADEVSPTEFRRLWTRGPLEEGRLARTSVHSNEMPGSTQGMFGHCLAPCHACLVCDASSRALFASSACGPCLLALVLLRVPAWTVSLCILWTSYMSSPSGLCATLAAMVSARDVISIYTQGMDMTVAGREAESPERGD